MSPRAPLRLGLALSALLMALFAASGALADPPGAHPRATATGAPRPAAVAPASAESPPSPEGVVNINTADAAALERLPGIGPARAQAILQLRERVRRFGHTDDLLRVRGIGRVSLRRLRPYLSLAGETTLTARPRRPRASAP